MKRNLRKNKKGISTVIATIIIVAITIVMAIAVAYWALGIGGSFTRFEKITFTSAWATANTDGTYTVNMILNNTGTAAATISTSNIMYNGKPGSAYSLASGNAADDAPVVYLNGGTTAVAQVTLQPGGSLGLAYITLPKAAAGKTPDWTSGMSVEVAIQTAAGNSYPKTINLP